MERNGSMPKLFIQSSFSVGESRVLKKESPHASPNGCAKRASLRSL